MFLIRTLSTVAKEPVLIQKLDHLMLIGINRPDRRNCINIDTAKCLTAAFKELEVNDDVYAAVLYGTGGNFSAGCDLTEVEKWESDETKPSILHLNQFKYFTKPVIAAISGYAVAEGLELALMCDLRVVEETALFGLYSRRFGVPLTNGGTVRLQALIGLSRALDLVLTGRTLNATEAYDWGLANRITSCGSSLGQAINLAMSLTKFPQRCMLVDRDSTYNAVYKGIQNDLFNFERNQAMRNVGSTYLKEIKRFFLGIGKHGKFYNLKEKPREHWELNHNNKSNTNE